MVEFDEESMAALVEPEVAARLGLRTRILKTPKAPSRMRGRQVHGEDILEEVTRLRLKHGAEYVIGFVKEDMYVPNMNFVFGLASRDTLSAVVSSHRLSSAEPEVFRDRLMKEVMHELGHVFGLGHCGDVRCVMHFSNSLSDTDLKSSSLCDKCKSMLSLP